MTARQGGITVNVACPLRAIAQYRAAHVPGNRDLRLCESTPESATSTISDLQETVGSYLHNIRPSRIHVTGSEARWSA